MSTIYMQFSNCIPVKGYTRSAFYDVQRNHYELVTNFVADSLLSNKHKISIDKIDDDFKHYIDTLVEEGWGIYTTKSIAALFPELNLNWDHYSSITNAQIDLNNNKTDIFNFFEKILPQFEKLICKEFQFNFLEHFSYQELVSFLISFDDTQANSIKILLPYIQLSFEESTKLFETQPRLHFLFFYNCPKNVAIVEQKNKIFYTEKKDISSRLENVILTDYFTNNILLFSESQKHNTYYNRKLCIDAEGNIKNSPEHEHFYGNIKDTRLEEAIKDSSFKDLWFIHKEMIDVCKDCEFRHMCVDACIPFQRENGTWYRSVECNYNPYIAKWKEEEKYQSLQECGITINSSEFKIDLIKLNQINQEIWGED